ncbi:MAG: DUF885 family protein [Acidobacteria bacterium]|nr:DUF885 family protein [Acidobacteriota bacterium]
MRLSRISVLFVAALLVVACQPAPPATDAVSDAESLGQIADEIWARQLDNNVYARLWKGLPFESLPDLSYEFAEGEAQYAQTVLDRLGAIDETALDHDDWLTWAVFKRNAEMTVEGFDFYWYSNVLTPYSNAVAGLRQVFAAAGVASPEERQTYLDLLRQVPGYVQQVEMLARGNVESGFTVSAQNMPAVIGLTRGAIQPGEAGMFAVPAARLEASEADEQPSDDVDAFQVELARLVEEEINPALEQLAEYLETDYAASAPDGVGLSQYELGDAYYRYLVRLHTTMDVTPEEVQQIGYEMIAEMKAEMAEIQAAIGFDGTFEEFREHIQTTPDYYPASPEEVDERIEAAANAFYERHDEFFARKPEAPFAARRLNPALEASQTYGYYNPPAGNDPAGYYNFNGSNLDQRAWINLKGLAYHELFPGHHYQIVRVLEDDSLPEARKAMLVTAYTEGWGSYSTFLGLEAGMIEDPISQYGIYILEIFLANRLVLDPGMNALGMTLEEARQFMRDNTFESETQIGTESLRYSTDMPGQALGYQMGKRKLMEIRAHAEAELGDAFDLRAFHEAVLSPGALPMSVLEEHINWWIDQQRVG